MDRKITRITEKVLSILEYASKFAKDIHDFRSILSQRAMEGDLDDAYETLHKIRNEVDEYIRTGQYRASPED